MKFPRTIYALRHDPTGKIYVGSTSSLWPRIITHISAIARGAHPVEEMDLDYKEHGGGYTVFILDVVRDMYDRNKEQLWIDALGTRDPHIGYNYTDKSRRAALDHHKAFEIPIKDCPEKKEAQRFVKNAERLAFQ